MKILFNFNNQQENRRASY